MPTLLIVSLIGSLAVFTVVDNSSSLFEIVNAQNNKVFKVIVNVKNIGDKDETGAVHVDVQGGAINDWINAQVFPARQTVSYDFEFSSNDVPTGSVFIAEVIFGDHHNLKIAYGQNGPENAPESVTITIP